MFLQIHPDKGRLIETDVRLFRLHTNKKTCSIHTFIPHTDVSVSIPTMVNATEGDGTVEVCAELSADSAVPINLRLATPGS